VISLDLNLNIRNRDVAADIAEGITKNRFLNEISVEINSNEYALTIFEAIKQNKSLTDVEAQFLFIDSKSENREDFELENDLIELIRDIRSEKFWLTIRLLS
jgi:hypothetical protein